MPDTATFCATCGTPVLGKSTSSSQAPSYSAIDYATPLYAQAAPAPATAAAPDSVPFPRNLSIGTVVAAVLGVSLLLGVLVGLSIHPLVARPSVLNPAYSAALSAMGFAMVLIAAMCWAACLFVGASLRGYDITGRQVLGIAAVCAVMTLVPFGGLLAMIVAFGLIQWWTAADWIETLVIVIVARLAMFVVTIPFVLGLSISLSLLH